MSTTIMLSQCEEPLAKRRRIGYTKCNGFSGDVHTYELRERRPFWFDDGDIIFQVEESLFKIHRCKLDCSIILWDMFELPQPAEAENINGCPLVAMAGDTSKDWMAVLRWIYEPESFFSQAAVFDILAGALRIATKYEMPALRAYAILELEIRWPARLASMTSNAFSNAAEAILLARECDVPSILPAAFYALSIQRWGFNADGGRSHSVLLPVDLRRLICGREALHEFLVQIILDPLERINSNFGICGSCSPTLTEYWREKLTPDPASPRGCWIVKELSEMIADETIGGIAAKLCPQCAECHRILVRYRLKMLAEEIPKAFKL